MIESVKAPPKLKKRVLSPRQQVRHNFVFGHQGEDKACQFLQNLGYRLLDSNVAYGHAEIDLIFHDPHQNEVVFVEVKRRLSGEYGSPSYAVNREKLKSMSYVAGAYRRRHRLTHIPFRFDIISIIGDNISHLKSVTWCR
ncbi:MAG TPA: YraN family protein [Candidatus Woesebacteria bacterium]|nr:YraN family protein [Candidatus Woesebacteria bacterium]